MRLRLWHGGIAGLRPGDLIQAGHDRPSHDGCPWCQGRELQASGGPVPTIDTLATHQDRVYLTPVREYASHYASLVGRGDLYRVDPVGELLHSSEDTIETWTAPTARVLAVVERAVLLTPTQRRRLLRIWTSADLAEETSS